ncbi:hypothetical protein ACFQ3R_03730 [Mesonia ostreae]|uniref:Uncharacterized protein n=1 Tax=Mesonia ostreae TaxID=861110 RepID=A0ABU2KJ46_9FLAO|nr:hypothetical protein [Mesonia ostreae]MDT0294741.1 hypothetical protein [Mesonia ostreae]
MKKPYLDLLVIIFLSGFSILANEMDWWQDYTAFVMVPLLFAYFMGKEVAKRQKK